MYPKIPTFAWSSRAVWQGTRRELHASARDPACAARAGAVCAEGRVVAAAARERARRGAAACRVVSQERASYRRLAQAAQRREQNRRRGRLPAGGALPFTKPPLPPSPPTVFAFLLLVFQTFLAQPSLRPLALVTLRSRAFSLSESSIRSILHSPVLESSRFLVLSISRFSLLLLRHLQLCFPPSRCLSVVSQLLPCCLPGKVPAQSYLNKCNFCDLIPALRMNEHLSSCLWKPCTGTALPLCPEPVSPPMSQSRRFKEQDWELHRTM
eukprot:6197010-Pleurochrysis_carterae.AAC.3